MILGFRAFEGFGFGGFGFLLRDPKSFTKAASQAPKAEFRVWQAPRFRVYRFLSFGFRGLKPKIREH